MGTVLKLASSHETPESTHLAIPNKPVRMCVDKLQRVLGAVLFLLSRCILRDVSRHAVSYSCTVYSRWAEHVPFIPFRVLVFVTVYSEALCVCITRVDELQIVFENCSSYRNVFCCGVSDMRFHIDVERSTYLGKTFVTCFRDSLFRYLVQYCMHGSGVLSLCG